jgi:hypothetical protein
MHTSVAPLPRFLGTVPDLPQRQRIGVRVGAALGERAEPAPGVADVGEVDVPGDDVGHVLAGGVFSHIVGQAGERIQSRTVGGEQCPRVGVADPRWIVGCAP